MVRIAKPPKVREYPHTPRKWSIAPGEMGTYCLSDGEVWPCAYARKKGPNSLALQTPPATYHDGNEPGQVADGN